jgi:hypothetical protein
MARDEVIASLRRSSTGFSRGSSKYRGVTRHHPYGKWEARIGRIRGQVGEMGGHGAGGGDGGLEWVAMSWHHHLVVWDAERHVVCCLLPPVQHPPP